LFGLVIYLRLGIDLVQEPAAIVLVKNAREPPRLVLEWLYVLNLHEEHISRFGRFNLERAREIVDLSQVDVQDIVSTVIVLDLSARPVQAFDLDRLSIFDRSAERD
jgi:hypothetical protein